MEGGLNRPLSCFLWPVSEQYENQNESNMKIDAKIMHELLVRLIEAEGDGWPQPEMVVELWERDHGKLSSAARDYFFERLKEINKDYEKFL